MGAEKRSKNAENDSPSQTGPTTPQKVEAPSSSELSKESCINDIREDIGAKDVDLETLTKHIAVLLEHIEKKKEPDSKQGTPKGLPKEISSTVTTVSKKLNHFLSTGVEIVCSLAHIIAGPVKEILKGIGHAHFATAGLLVVVYCLERYEDFSENKEECLKLLKEMCYVAGLVKVFKENPKGLLHVIEDATALIVEGAILCCTQMDTHTWKHFIESGKEKADLIKATEKLDRMYLKINIHMGFRKSPLWKGCPKHAAGIDEPAEYVMKLLECESKQNAVTVILHGFRGTGKTTLADAVFSKVELGYKYSKVRLFKDIDSTPDIIEFQKVILKDLMEPEETLPDIRTHEDGQNALEEKLEKVEAFIYIDNVLKSSELQLLLPKSVDKAKRVRFLITAPEIKDLKYACPTRPKTYHMKGILDPTVALGILKKEIKENINESQLKEIIEICGGVPLMVTLVASFIGRANDKQKAYDILKQETGKCAILDNSKDPDSFLNICLFFKKLEWDTVTDTLEEEVKPSSIPNTSIVVASEQPMNVDIAIPSPLISQTLKESNIVASQLEVQRIALSQSPEMNTNHQQRIMESSSTLGKRKRNLQNAFNNGRESGDQ